MTGDIGLSLVIAKYGYEHLPAAGQPRARPIRELTEITRQWHINKMQLHYKRIWSSPTEAECLNGLDKRSGSCAGLRPVPDPEGSAKSDPTKNGESGGKKRGQSLRGGGHIPRAI